MVCFIGLCVLLLIVLVLHDVLSLGVLLYGYCVAYLLFLLC